MQNRQENGTTFSVVSNISLTTPLFFKLWHPALPRHVSNALLSFSSAIYVDFTAPMV
jgi:hypothetical protein